MRKARRNPRAHRRISEHRLRTIAKRVHRRYNRWMMREYGFLDHDWVRVLGKYDLDIASTWRTGEWVMSKWSPTPDGGWQVESVSSSSLLKRAESLLT